MSKQVKDIQSIIKESAERYGIEYDESQAQAHVIRNGVKVPIKKEDFLKAVME